MWLVLALTGLAWGVPVDLPPALAEDPAWTEAIAVAGATLGGSATGPVVRIVPGPTRWQVEVHDRHGVDHLLFVAPPTTAEAREDLLATALSLVEPVEIRLPQLTLPDPPPDRVPRPAPAARPPRPAPDPPRPTAPVAAEPAAVPDPPRPTAPVAPEPPAVPDPPPDDAVVATALPDPVPVAPEPPALVEAPEPAVAEAAPAVVPAPARDLDVSPEPPSWRLVARATLGAGLRPGTAGGVTLAAAVGAHRARFELAAGVRVHSPVALSATERRVLTAGDVAATVAWVGPSVRVAVGAGVSGRRWTDAAGPVGATATPVTVGEVEVVAPVGPRLGVVAGVWTAVDLGPTWIFVDGRPERVLSPVVAGASVGIVWSRSSNRIAQ